MNTMARVLSGAVIAGIAMTALAGGLQTGDKCGPFKVNDVTGPHKGKQLCYV